ncbi:MAG: hypothetical protein K5672_06535 [Bacteroidaceae bacterium]|nr:hypothetical protein [Bacteroidaceae bacterium]
MDNNISTNYIPLQPPYKIIKHGNKIGVHIGTQILTILRGKSMSIETHNFPVVAVEDRISALNDKNISCESNGEGEVWDNVETKQVSELCELGAQLQWMDFIKILWHDHARLGNRHEKIQKVYIFNKILKYNGSQELPSSGQYTIHLHTESSGSVPEVVCSARDDIFALNVVWIDDPVALEQSIVSDLMEYLLIISPNQSARWWRMTYETDEEQLCPLIDRLNANAKATSFRNTLMASFKVTALIPYEENFDKFDTKPSSQPSPSRKKGRAKAPDFEEFIRDDAPHGFMDVLKEMLDGKTGKIAFAIILAALKWMKEEPPMQSVLNRFKSVKKTSYSTARDKHYKINNHQDDGKPIPEKELAQIREEIERKLKKWGGNSIK